MTGPTPEQLHFTHDILGVNPADYKPNALKLDMPGAPAAPDQAGAIQAPQLHFNLSPDELNACNSYLDWHFDVVLANGAPYMSLDSYKPALEGVPVSVDDVVAKLMPLTLAGKMSKDGKDKMYADESAQLYDLVRHRVAAGALAKSKAAQDEALRQMTDTAVAAAYKKKAAIADAQKWIDDYLRGKELRPYIMGDGSGSTVMFDNKSQPVETVVTLTLAAAKQATLPSGADGLAEITDERVRRSVAKVLYAARPKAPGPPGKKPPGDDFNMSVQLGYTFTPQTTHTTASGNVSTDQPAQQISGTLNLAFHADDQSGWELSATGQVTWFADEKGQTIRTQSGFVGAQVAWVWSFLDGALTAGPLFQALVGYSRAQQTASHKLEWEPTGQVGLGGQVQYAVPGFNGHVMIGMQAGASGTMAKGADGTVDQTAAFTFTYKF